MNRTHLTLLGLILTFAAALRIYNLSTLGYWTDEFCSLSEANGHGLQLDAVATDQLLPPLPSCTRWADAGPASAILPALAHGDTHPPLYFLVLRLWERCFGDAEAAVRSLDVCFSVAAIGLLFVAARPDVGATAALWACLVMAVASPQVQFAQEARNYAPVLAFSLAAVVAARRLIARPTAAAAAGLAGCLLAMMLTHYYAAAVAVVLAIHMASVARGRALAYAAAAFGGSAVAFGLLWGPAVASQLPVFRNGDMAWLSDPNPGHAGRAAVALCKLPVRWVADVNAPWAAWGGVLFGGVAWAVVRRPLRLWALWVLVPTGLIFAGDVLHHTTQLTLLRYTLFATPGAYVLLAAAGRRTGWAVPAAAAVAGLLALPAAYVPPWKVDFRTPVEFVGRQLGPNDGLVVSGPDTVSAEMAWVAFRHYRPTMPAATVILTRRADGPTLSRLAACPRVAVVWLWPDRPIASFVPGFAAADAGRLPPFGTVAVGRVVSRGPR